MAGVVASKVRKQRAKERPSLKEADKEEKRPIKVLKCPMQISCWYSRYSIFIIVMTIKQSYTRYYKCKRTCNWRLTKWSMWIRQLGQYCNWQAWNRTKFHQKVFLFTQFFIHHTVWFLMLFFSKTYQTPKKATKMQKSRFVADVACMDSIACL